jgi:hypothetical protein
MKRTPLQIGVLCPLCDHFAPFSVFGRVYVIEGMVGTRRLELLTSTVSNLDADSDDQRPKKPE